MFHIKKVFFKKGHRVDQEAWGTLSCSGWASSSRTVKPVGVIFIILFSPSTEVLPCSWSVTNQAGVCVLSQSHSTLCNPKDRSPPGSSIHGILQARILEWVAVSPPGDLPDPGMEPRSPALQADSLPPEPPGKPLATKER